MHMHKQNRGYNFPSNRETERNRGGLNWPPPAGVYYTSESEPGCKVRRSRHISISEDGSRANHGGGAGGSLASSYGSSSQQGRMPMQHFGRALSNFKLGHPCPSVLSPFPMGNGRKVANTKFVHNIKCCTPPWLSSHSSANLSLFLAGE